MPRFVLSVSALPSALGYWLVRHRLGVSIGIVALQSLLAMLQASASIDGVWYFWLDDDQMVSMRYGRNLAQGHGLVWNPGERVEGYTNFLWTVVMAAIHLLPVSDAAAAIPVQLLNAALLAAILVAIGGLARRCGLPELPSFLLLLTLSLNLDLVYWAVHGFETTCVTAIFVWVLHGTLAREPSPMPRIGMASLLALLPLIRSDALYVWAAAALMVLIKAPQRRRTLATLLLTLLPFGLHLIWRRSYYGDWLPNTYYLRVADVIDRWTLAADYLSRFAWNYAPSLLLATVGCIRAASRRYWILLLPVPVGVAYVLAVGEDLFAYSRFLAFSVPGLMLLAVFSLQHMVRTPVSQSFLLAGYAALSTWLVGTTSLEALRDDNGKPLVNAVTGVLLREHAGPDASVAVLAAGNVPYFSRLNTVDLLGKSDRVIARSPPHRDGYVGHNKYDPEYSLARRPDYVVLFWLHSWAIHDWTIEQARQGGDAWITALVTSPTFRREYLGNPVPLRYLLENNSVYVRNDSPERRRLGHWHEPTVIPAPGLRFLSGR